MRPHIRSIKTITVLRNHIAGSTAPPSNQNATTKPTNAQPDANFAESPPDAGLPLQFLSRPLGVSEAPSVFPKSWADKRAELLDREKHMEKRRHL
jgi:ATPase complex subunit ATP10